jgi:MOSC domain-containing protein YiiM
MKGKITAVCISDTKGVRKTPCPSGMFLENYGMENDAHAECGIKRQVSLLSVDSIEKMKSMGLNVGPGDFAENLTVE